MADINEIPANAENLKSGVSDTGSSIPTSATSPTFDYERGQEGDVYAALGDNWLLNFISGGYFKSMSNLEREQYQRYLDKYDREMALYQFLANQEYNASESQKQRDWELMMSNTAIQRRMADLEAAGVNPLLAVSSVSSGASTPSGSAAHSGTNASESSGRTSYMSGNSGSAVKTIAGIAGILKIIEMLV